MPKKERNSYSVLLFKRIMMNLFLMIIVGYFGWAFMTILLGSGDAVNFQSLKMWYWF